MSDVSLEDALAHGLTIIDGYTNHQFTGGWDDITFSAPLIVDSTAVTAVWTSTPLPLRDKSIMSLVAKSVHVQISTTVTAPADSIATVASRDSFVVCDARGRFQLNVVMAFMGHTGIVFNTSRTMHFMGNHFFHFDN